MNLPEGVTVSCPIKDFQQRFLTKGCAECEYFKGTQLLTDADFMPVKDPLTGEDKGERPIQWHEKNMITCAFPMTRRCSNMSVVEE